MNHSISIFPIPVLKDNYVWIIVSNDKSAVIVDPGESQPVKSYLSEHDLNLKGMLITHHHWDHTNGILEVKEAYDVPVVGPEIENINGKNISVNESEKVSFANFPLEFTVIAIPGHTLGHVAYYSDEILFCGDTLFASGCGRIFEGTPAQMLASLQKIATLPLETKIYPAHEYTLNNLRFAELVEPGNRKIKERLKHIRELREQHKVTLPTTLADEKDTNPFLRYQQPEIIANVEKYAGKKLKDPVEIFAWLRRWKDGFS